MLLQGKMLDPNQTALAAAMMGANPEEQHKVEQAEPDNREQEEKEEDQAPEASKEVEEPEKD